MISIDKLLGEVKAAVKEKKTKGKKTVSYPNQAKEPPKAITASAWKFHSVVCIIREVSCKTCGNVTSSQEPNLFVKRTRVVRGIEESHLTKVCAPNYKSVFGNLPARVEYMSAESIVCEHCFILNPEETKRQMEFPI